MTLGQSLHLSEFQLLQAGPSYQPCASQNWTRSLGERHGGPKEPPVFRAVSQCFGESLGVVGRTTEVKGTTLLSSHSSLGRGLGSRLRLFLCLLPRTRTVREHSSKRQPKVAYDVLDGWTGRRLLDLQPPPCYCPIAPNLILFMGPGLLL